MLGFLTFVLDGHEYTLLRSREDDTYGTNLKITVDGADKSGKGIKESEDILEQLLPDITSELIGSVIILGQGMPQKFTNNTPAKRKEILEHLSKSDFMIQDLKERVEKRQSEVQQKVTEGNNTIISINSKISVYKQQKEQAETELIEASKPTDYDATIESLNTHIKVVEKAETGLQSLLEKFTGESKTYTDEYSAAMKEKQTALDTVRNQHDEVLREFNIRKTELTGKIYALESEIGRLESIKDVCPTCGQKIPGAVKPDTTKQREELTKLKTDLESLRKEMTEDESEYREVLNQIGLKFDTKISEAKHKLDTANDGVRDSNVNLRNAGAHKGELNAELTRVTALKQNHESNIKRIKDSITNLSGLISGLEADYNKTFGEVSELSKHLDVLSKMSTYLKRDFRGFLLENIIEYISKKAKDYCSQIFGSDEIVFELDGNNIGISYCGKDYENLSGGEKQRVDLIIQFAIRDMMCNYLGFNSNILVLDEITDNLDSISCDKVLNFITRELNNVNSVFIISHHSDELEIPSDSEIVVEKNENGVSEVQ